MRTIMIFPRFVHGEIIDRIRKKYDPLCNLIRPHITLVFPFEDDITNEQLEVVLNNCLEGTKSFKLVLKGISKQEDSYGNYLFLNVEEGSRDIMEIHNKLYSSLFDKREHSCYIPHMTIGKLPSKVEMNQAYFEIKNIDICLDTIVTKISVEMIGEHDESIMVIEKNLEQVRPCC